jgi:ParB family chromosome partitioning protein
MVALAGKVASERLSVRETERLVREAKEEPAKGKPAAQARPKQPSPAARAMVDELQRLFGTKVHLHDRGDGRGSIEIEFFSYEDLDRLLSLFRK